MYHTVNIYMQLLYHCFSNAVSESSVNGNDEFV